MSAEKGAFLLITSNTALQANPVATTLANAEQRYLHKDHLGSIVASTNQNLTVIERLAYEPFGKRRFASGQTGPPGSDQFFIDVELLGMGMSQNRRSTEVADSEACPLIPSTFTIQAQRVSKFPPKVSTAQATREAGRSPGRMPIAHALPRSAMSKSGEAKKPPAQKSGCQGLHCNINGIFIK